MVPTKIVCIGWNYRSHVKELESELPREPTVFLKPPSCLIRDGDDIVIPAGITNVQHEVELAVVFGRRCKDVPEDEALSCISHVAVFNDVSARDSLSCRYLHATDSSAPVAVGVVRHLSDCHISTWITEIG